MVDDGLRSARVTSSNHMISSCIAVYMRLDLRKPGILSKRACGAMRVYSISGQKLSKFSFCRIRIHVKELFY